MNRLLLTYLVLLFPPLILQTKNFGGKVYETQPSENNINANSLEYFTSTRKLDADGKTTCDSNDDCLSQQICLEHKCQHKELFPLSFQDALLLISVFLTNFIGISSGFSGGFLYDFLYTITANFSFLNSNQFSTILVFLSSLTSFLLLAKKPHPDDENKLLIDYHIGSFLIPNLLVGMLIGYPLNFIIPKVYFTSLLIGICVFYLVVLIIKIRNPVNRNIVLDYLLSGNESASTGKNVELNNVNYDKNKNGNEKQSTANLLTTSEDKTLSNQNGKELLKPRRSNDTLTIFSEQDRDCFKKKLLILTIVVLFYTLIYNLIIIKSVYFVYVETCSGLYWIVYIMSSITIILFTVIIGYNWSDEQNHVFTRYGSVENEPNLNFQLYLSSLAVVSGVFMSGQGSMGALVFAPALINLKAKPMVIKSTSIFCLFVISLPIKISVFLSSLNVFYQYAIVSSVLAIISTIVAILLSFYIIRKCNDLNNYYILYCMVISLILTIGVSAYGMFTGVTKDSELFFGQFLKFKDFCVESKK